MVIRQYSCCYQYCWHQQALFTAAVLCQRPRPLLQDDLSFCINKKLPVLLAKGQVKLIVIDSIAALFRCDFSVHEAAKRAKQLSAFAAQLTKLNCQYNAPVICVNQVYTHCICDWTLPQVHISDLAVSLFIVSHAWICVICIVSPGYGLSAHFIFTHVLSQFYMFI